MEEVASAVSGSTTGEEIYGTTNSLIMGDPMGPSMKEFIEGIFAKKRFPKDSKRFSDNCMTKWTFSFKDVLTGEEGRDILVVNKVFEYKQRKNIENMVVVIEMEFYKSIL